MKIEHPFRAVKEYVFNGLKYRMLWRKHRNPESRAACDPPETEEYRRNMFIDPSEDAKGFLEQILHEGTHAEQYYLDEPTVIRISVELSELLWKVGFRLTDGNGNVVERAKKKKDA